MSEGHPVKKCLKKVVLLGDSGVGKTSLMSRFVKNQFNDHYKATIGADFLTKSIVIDERRVTLQIWDTAGQERFQSLGVAFYRGADCCILVYDITNQKSFSSLKQWKDEFLVQAAPSSYENFPFVVLGNKVDLEEARAVSTESGEKFARQEGDLPFYECSAKQNSYVDDAFHRIAQITVSQEDEEEPYIPSVVRLDDGPEEEVVKKGGCCGKS